MNELIEKYLKASELFNQDNKNKYKIDIFLDINFLNIYVRDLKNNKFYHCQILNNLIKDMTINEILQSYNELVEKVKVI